MRFFSLRDLTIVKGIDVSQYPHGDDLTNRTTMETGSFRLIAPVSWNVDALLNNVRAHKPFDQLLYCDIRLSANDSVTTLLPADCFLIELPFPGCRSLYEQGDESMPILVCRGFALFICFANTTLFQIDETHYLLNNAGNPVVTESINDFTKQDTPASQSQDEYVLEF